MSKGHCDESRPELVFRLTVGNLCLSVLHIDPLPPPDSTRSSLAPMASEFFHMMANDQLHLRGFLQARALFDQACPHDHLRYMLLILFNFTVYSIVGADTVLQDCQNEYQYLIAVVFIYFKNKVIIQDDYSTYSSTKILK